MSESNRKSEKKPGKNVNHERDVAISFEHQAWTTLKVNEENAMQNKYDDAQFYDDIYVCLKNSKY